MCSLRKTAAHHEPVLLQDVMHFLAPEEGEVVVDGTLGGAGYARELCGAIGESGTLVGLDRDADAVVAATQALSSEPCAVHLFEGNFRAMSTYAQRAGITKADAIVLDLGISTAQLFSSGRGFSFAGSEPLVMTFADRHAPSDITAGHIINNWSEEALANVLYGYGEEKAARAIARAIVAAREEGAIETTDQLVSIIQEALPPARRAKGKHHATKVFQALRIAVNDELGALEEGLENAFGLLAEGGRLVVVSFHSLEDRIVKRFFRTMAHEGNARVLTKKPIIPSEEEVAHNSRSRSAKLRALIKETSQ